jgi:uncharacterized membrane protein (UPF0127 family)
MTSVTVTPTTGAGRVPEGFEAVVIEVTKADGSVAEYCVLLADTPERQARGLMDVDGVGRYTGMLFDFAGPTMGQFYMLRTRIPLSIAFFGLDGRFVSSTDMQPCPEDDDDPPCPRYQAEDLYVSALEVPLGDLEPLGIGAGSTLRRTTRSC